MTHRYKAPTQNLDSTTTNSSTSNPNTRAKAIAIPYGPTFNNQMHDQGRKVLLLIDNFSGHEFGVQLVRGKQGLSNVQIERLLPNTTSYWQPLDQGIIASFKL